MGTAHFKGCAVLITGASRGIGAALALAFAREGALVGVNYLRHTAAADAVVAQCQAAGGDAIALQADVRSPEAVQAMLKLFLAEAGGLQAVVNNAFAPYAFDPEQRAKFWEMGWPAFQTQYEGAVQSAFNVTQAVLPHFRQRGHGSIVNMVTDLVARPTIPYHDYTTAKSALVGFSRNLAAELGPLGIRVNCVAPGLVHPTDSSRPTREAVKDMIVAQTPMGRLASPDDIAGPVLFLASDWSRFVTGQVLTVDGGLVMS